MVFGYKGTQNRQVDAWIRMCQFHVVFCISQAVCYVLLCRVDFVCGLLMENVLGVCSVSVTDRCSIGLSYLKSIQ